jgi:hypothetical protein
MTAPAICPVPGCGGCVPKGNVVCVACYFAMPAHEARLLVRTRIVRDRAESEEARVRLSETLDRYLAIAISHLPQRDGPPPEPAEEECEEPDAWADTGYRRACP